MSLTGRQLRTIQKTLNLTDDQVQEVRKAAKKNDFRDNVYLVPIGNAFLGLVLVFSAVIFGDHYYFSPFALTLGLIEFGLAAFGVYIYWHGLALQDPQELVKELQ